MSKQNTKLGLFIFIFIWLIVNSLLIICNYRGIKEDVKDIKEGTNKIANQLEIDLVDVETIYINETE